MDKEVIPTIIIYKLAISSKRKNKKEKKICLNPEKFE